MTNDKTENTRALLQRIISDSCDAEGAGEVVIQRADWEELCALLTNPSAEPLGVEPVGQSQPAGYARSGNLRNLALVPMYGSIELDGIPRQEDSVPLYTAPPEQIGRAHV